MAAGYERPFFKRKKENSGPQPWGAEARGGAGTGLGAKPVMDAQLLRHTRGMASGLGTLFSDRCGSAWHCVSWASIEKYSTGHCILHIVG